MFDGLGENSRFSMQPVAEATLNMFCKRYSIVFFVHFGRGELYLEMMLQDKLANPYQRFDLFASVGGLADGKVKRRRRDGWNGAEAERPPPCR
jgi:hypothetical protein